MIQCESLISRMTTLRRLRGGGKGGSITNIADFAAAGDYRALVDAAAAHLSRT